LPQASTWPEAVSARLWKAPEASRTQLLAPSTRTACRCRVNRLLSALGVPQLVSGEPQDQTSPVSVRASECIAPAATWRTRSDGRQRTGSATKGEATAVAAVCRFSLPPLRGGERGARAARGGAPGVDGALVGDRQAVPAAPGGLRDAHVGERLAAPGLLHLLAVAQPEAGLLVPAPGEQLARGAHRQRLAAAAAERRAGAALAVGAQGDAAQSLNRGRRRLVPLVAA